MRPATSSTSDASSSTPQSNLEDSEELPNLRSLASLRQQLHSCTETLAGEEKALQPHKVVQSRKPSHNSEAFYDERKLSSCATVKSRLVEEKLFYDADEVLRKKDKSATRKYMELAYEGFSDLDSKRLADVQKIVDKLSSTCEAFSNDRDISDGSPLRTSRAAIWVEVLQSLTDEELRALWKYGFLDAEVMKELLEGEDEGGEEGQKALPQEDDATLQDSNYHVPLQRYISLPKISFAQQSMTLLDEKVEQFRRVYKCIQLTKGIEEAALSDLPTVDLAPAMQKVYSKDFENVSDTDLDQLQRYEESPSIHLSARDRGVTHQSTITEAMLRRALAPSNKFLAAVARRDKDVDKALSILERIKRHTLLDSVFQDAVHTAAAMDSKEMMPYLPRRQGGVRRERRKRLAGYKGSRDPVERLDMATDMPLFYASPHSVVPPHGRYGLPLPRVPKALKQMIRRRKRKSYTRFSR